MRNLKIIPGQIENGIKYDVYFVDHIDKLSEFTLDNLSYKLRRINTTIPRKLKIIRIYGL